MTANKPANKPARNRVTRVKEGSGCYLFHVVRPDGSAVSYRALRTIGGWRFGQAVTGHPLALVAGTVATRSTLADVRSTLLSVAVVAGHDKAKADFALNHLLGDA